jgi:hypothetical protein
MSDVANCLARATLLDLLVLGIVALKLGFLIVELVLSYYLIAHAPLYQGHQPIHRGLWEIDTLSYADACSSLGSEKFELQFTRHWPKEKRNS